MIAQINEKLKDGRWILDALMGYVTENISIAIVVAYISDITIYKISKYGAKLLERSQETVEGISFKDAVKELNILHADGITPARVEELPLPRVINNGEAVINEEWIICRPGGEKIIILVNACSIRNPNGTIVGGVSVWKDITKQKQMQRELGDVAKFSDENPHPLLRVTQDGTILYANPSSMPLLQDWNCKIGQSAPDFLHQIVADTFHTKLIKENIEVRYKDQIFSFTIVPVIGTSYINLYGLNVTQQKLAEEELEKYRKHLEELVEARTAELKMLNEQLKQEIIERTRVEKDLRISERRHRFLLDNLPVRIFYKDKNSVYIACNEHFARDLHRKPEEVIGKTDYDFFPKELADKYRTDDRKIMESGQIEAIEEEYKRNGQKLIIHTVKVPIKNENGECVGILGSFSDITEKINLEKEAERSRHLALLGELAAGVAHEINNPITGVINCAQILLNKNSEGSREKDLASRIIREGDRIASIVSKLLSFARDRDKKERSTINIQEVLSDTLILTGTQLRQEGIKVKLDIPKDLPEIYVNPHEIQQVFMNFISNARYALNQKYPGIHENKILEVSCEKITMNEHLYVKITFYDHGIGIPAHIRDKTMDPFFTTKPTSKGTGLGLSISYNIIVNHNGKLTIDSVEGEFTKVILILPTGEYHKKQEKSKA
ncbi:MAG: Circadian input kinase A [Candidatus Jettenia ecosi]|uniref:histidine kinase n=1 Tax=Candidatus Jettenia ecosi TaxID=2494326 RepID=A0A533QG37_9BACT|nr:MAG: Circadian input kinase A [Candidatus Jettenia ecosi]